MRLTTRAALGWPPTQAARATPTKGLVIHYDGSVQGLAGKSHGECVAYWKRTRSFHMGSSKGWADIGYSFGACPHGEVFEGRGLNHAQAAQPGGNSTWYSVTLMSGDGERPTPGQIDAVRQLRSWLMGKGVAGEVRGHRDFVVTECPGDLLYGLVRDGTFKGPPSGQGGGDMPTPKELWQHELAVPYGSKENPSWQAGNILVNNGIWLRKLATKIDAQAKVIEAQSAALGEMATALAAKDQEIDVEALVLRFEAALDRVRVRLEVAPEEES